MPKMMKLDKVKVHISNKQHFIQVLPMREYKENMAKVNALTNKIATTCFEQQEINIILAQF
jgi:hypothetical protein